MSGVAGLSWPWFLAAWAGIAVTCLALAVALSYVFGVLGGVYQLPDFRQRRRRGRGRSELAAAIRELSANHPLPMM